MCTEQVFKIGRRKNKEEEEERKRKEGEEAGKRDTCPIIRGLSNIYFPAVEYTGITQVLEILCRY